MSSSPIKISHLTLVNNIILAPMAGITNSPYRQINKRAGVGLVYSEMISANGLIRDGQRTIELLQRSAVEMPFGVQLFGEDPTVLAQAVTIASAYGEVIDLNMGCPVKKVIRSGAGSALLKDPLLVGTIISAMRKASALPLTIKFRSGWDLSSINFLEIGKIAEQSGADALILHPRTRCQGFGGHANWEHIQQLKQAVHIPVIGSGDIVTPDDAIQMLQQTNCDGVMIGRGAYGNPWLISDILRLQLGEPISDPTPLQRLNTINAHLNLALSACGEHKTINEMRKHLCWYARGMSGAGDFRSRVNKCCNLNELRTIITTYFRRDEQQ